MERRNWQTEGVTRRIAVPLFAPWHRVPGGTAWAASSMIAAVLAANAGVDETFEIVSPYPGGGPAPADVPLAAAAGPVEWHKLTRLLPLPLLYESWDRLGAPSVERLVGRKPVDLVHFVAPLAPRHRSRGKKRVPMTATVHDVFPLQYPDLFPDRGRRLMSNALRTVASECDVVCVSSETTRDTCVDHGFRPERLRVIPLGVDQRRASDAEVHRVVAHYDLLRPYVICVGTLEPRKNLGAVLAAAAGLDSEGFDLVLVGPSGWHDASGLVDTATATRPNVRWLGRVPQEDVAPLQCGATVAAVPSLAEGFGLPVAEAMVQGTAVVTSTGTATAEVAGDAAMLADPQDTQAVVDAIMSVATDSRLRSELETRGSEQVKQFTWARHAALVRQVWAEVTS